MELCLALVAGIDCFLSHAKKHVSRPGHLDAQVGLSELGEIQC